SRSAGRIWSGRARDLTRRVPVTDPRGDGEDPGPLSRPDRPEARRAPRGRRDAQARARRAVAGRPRTLPPGVRAGRRRVSPGRHARPTSSSRSRAACTGRRRSTRSSSRRRSMTERYFTPADVEKLIPALTRIMDEVMPAYREANAARERREAEQQRIAVSGGGVVDRAAWRADTELAERLTQRVRKGVDRILSLGGAPKDLGLGLVDFLHLREGAEG